MNNGMLWFDDSKRALAIKVEEAALYHERKYGRLPNVCLVHPGMVTEDSLIVRGIAVRMARYVQPGHLWIGVEIVETPTTNEKRIPKGDAVNE